jgi:hypothetical protein
MLATTISVFGLLSLEFRSFPSAALVSTAKGQNLFMGMNRVYVIEVQIYACGAKASKYKTESVILVGKPKG